MLKCICNNIKAWKEENDDENNKNWVIKTIREKIDLPMPVKISRKIQAQLPDTKMI